MARLLALSLLCAAVGAGLIKLHVDEIHDQAWGGPPVTIVVVTEDLSAGTRLSQEHLALADRPVRYVETRHVPADKLETVLGLSLAEHVQLGEPLMWTDLAGMQSGPRQLSSLVPEGTRAMTLHATAASFSGLLRPGDRVDVLTRGASEPGTTVTKTVLENILVLAVGAYTGGPGENTNAASSSITVNVTPSESAKLADAERTGELRITLRNGSDSVVREVRHAG